MVASKKNLNSMSAVVTPAKITAPVLSDVYPRTRLFRELDQALKKPVVWITGPGGAGKTTAVVSYLEARKYRPLWYQVDRGDDDIASFFYYLGLAAKAHSPQCRLPLLTPEYLRGLSAFIANYFREFFQQCGPRDVLVIDNYQDTPAQGKLAEILVEGLEQISARSHVIVVSREVPPIAFAAVEARGQLAVIEWETLRLTEEECIAIADLRSRRTPLSRDVVHRLHAATQGWVAGLVLLTEHTERNVIERESSQGVASQAVFDYFASEIFRHRDRAIQTFLLKTVFFPKVLPAEAKVITEEPKAADILRALARQSLFTVEHEDGSYEYHPLFRAFLTNRALTVFGAEELTRLKRRTASSLAEREEITEAIALFQEAEDWEGALQLVLNHAPAMVGQGRTKTVERWLQHFPPSMRTEHPWVLYWRGVCSLVLAPLEARLHFEKAFAFFEKQSDASPLYLAWCGIIDSFTFAWSDFTPMQIWLDRYGDLAAGRTPPRADIEANSVFTYLSGLIPGGHDRPELPRVVARAEMLWQEHTDEKWRLTNSTPLINYYVWMGETQRLADMLEHLAPYVRQSDATPLAKLTWYARKALFLDARGRSEEALTLVNEGLALADATGVHVVDMRLFSAGVSAELCLGRVANANSFVERMLPFTSHSALARAVYDYNASCVAIHRGDFERAVELGRQSVEAFKKAGVLFGVAGSLLGLAYAYALQGDENLAVSLHEEARSIAKRIGSKVSLCSCDFNDAYLCYRRGDVARALDFLRESVKVGERMEMGVTQAAWFRREDLSALFALALEHGIRPDFVRRVIRNMRLSPPGHYVASWPWTMKIYTLGHFSLIKDGVPLWFSGKIQKKPLELLRALIACRGASASAEKLIETLWPEMGADIARSTFRSTIMRLRRLIGEDAVLFEDGRVALDPARCWVDVWAIEQLSEDAIEPITALNRADQLLALYKGPFLADDETPLVLLQRERLRSKFLRMIARFGERLETSGDSVAAIPLYEKAIEIDPLSEELCRRLMRSYTRTARFAEALALYDRCRAALGSLLRVAPSPETEALHREICQALPVPGAI